MKRERLLPLIVATALFIENMDSTAITTSLPMIATDLGVEPVTLRLALTTYMLALAVFIPVSGWVADRFGARPTFMAAIGVFLLGSLACALAGSLGELVGARFLQGTGGAMMVPVGRLVLLRSIPKDELLQALSWLTIPALLGPMLGPPLGGLITTYGHWRFIFLINLPIGLVGIYFAWRHIPLLKQAVKPLDWSGFALSASGLALTIFGFSILGRHLVSLSLALGCLLVGLVLLGGYVLHARRHPHPLIDLGMLQLATFRTGVLGGSLFRIGVGALPFLLPLMLQLSFGLSPLQSGLLTFVSAVGAMFMKSVAPRIIRWFGFRRVLVVNALVASLLLCAYGLIRADTPYPLIISVLLIGGCFRSLQFTSLNAIIYADVGADRMAQASGFAAMAQQVSLAIGVTIGGYALSISSVLTGQPLDAVINFAFAFLTVGLISASSAWMMLRLKDDAGAEMAGRAQAGREISEPRPAQRPGT
ncbi:MAG: MFS transporter [Lysobacter sp.]